MSGFLLGATIFKLYLGRSNGLARCVSVPIGVVGAILGEISGLGELILDI